MHANLRQASKAIQGTVVHAEEKDILLGNNDRSGCRALLNEGVCIWP